MEICSNVGIRTTPYLHLSLHFNCNLSCHGQGLNSTQQGGLFVTFGQLAAAVFLWTERAQDFVSRHLLERYRTDGPTGQDVAFLGISARVNNF